MSNLKFTNDDIYSILDNVSKGSNKHFVCDCPFCGKEKHFFIKGQTDEVDKRGDNKSFNYDCKKCSANGKIYSLLKHLGLLLQYVENTIDLNNLFVLKEQDKTESDDEEVLTKKQKLPIGFKRIYTHPYLLDRGLTTSDFYKYNIGITNLKQKLQDYIIFSVEEKGECKGYVSRCVLSKDEINRNKLLRYINSKSEFGKLLFGIDEITDRTKTIILVEGIFDKIRLDNLLQIDEDDSIKVCCTFGKKISKYQIVKILPFEPETVILFYDLDAIEDTKKYGLQLKTFFKDVKIACLLSGKDPDDSDDSEIINALNNLSTPFSFFYDKVGIKPLKIA